MSEGEKRVELNISIREIDGLLCQKCKTKLRNLIRSKLPDSFIEQAVLKKQEEVKP